MVSSEAWTQAMPSRARPARISRQEAWQPLAVPSFDAAGVLRDGAAGETAREAEQQLAQQLEAAWQNGHETGFAAARQQQQDAEAALGMDARTRCDALLNDLGNGLQALEGDLARQVMNLALEIGRHIACEQIRRDAQRIVPVLKSILGEIGQRHRQLEVQLHPDDASAARDWFSSEHPEIRLKLIGNPRLSRGGCVVNAGSTVVDGQLETRVRRAFAALGAAEMLNEADGVREPEAQHPDDADTPGMTADAAVAVHAHESLAPDPSPDLQTGE